MSSQIYGIVVDPHLPRQDRGVPAYFDGWYDNVDAAREALRHFKAQSPGAHAYLVMQLSPEPTELERAILADVQKIGPHKRLDRERTKGVHPMPDPKDKRTPPNLDDDPVHGFEVIPRPEYDPSRDDLVDDGEGGVEVIRRTYH
jgi:hypothetical protein